MRSSGRPTISSTSVLIGTWAVSWVATRCPSRRTATRSAIAGDLVEAVTDVDETDAFRLQPPDLFEKPLGLFRAQRGGRLVEYQQARVERQRLGDLDLLLRGDAKVAHERRGRSLESQAAQLLGGAPIHQLAINTAAPHRETPDKHILGDRQVP